MRTLFKDMAYPSRGSTFKLYHLTDLHVGAKTCNEARLRADIAIIAGDDSAYWTGGGDYVDAICQVGDKRYKPEGLAEWALGYTDLMGVQAEHVVNLLRPIAHKCLGMGDGNHEWQAQKYYARNIYWEIVKGVATAGKLDPADLAFGAQGFIMLGFKRKTGESTGNHWRMVTFLHHGYGGGRLPGGHALTLGRALSDYQCDLALFGHRHTFMLESKVFTLPGLTNKSKPRFRQSWGAFVPGYLEQYSEPMPNGEPVDTYPELLALPPQPVGTFPILIKPMERRIVFQVNSEPLSADFTADERKAA